MKNTLKSVRNVAAILAAVTLLSPQNGFAASAPTSKFTLPSPMTLDQAIAIMLANHPQRSIALSQVESAAGQKDQAQAQYAPSITPAYQFQNQTQNFVGVRTGTGTGTGTSADAVSTVRGGGLSIALSQNLYDGGQREATNAEARHNLQAAGYGLINTSQELVETVSVDFYQVLADIDLVKVAQAAIVNNQQLLDQTNAQIQVGTVAPKDAFQAQANLANAQVSLLQAQIAQSTDEAQLKSAMGVETESTVQLAPPLPTGKIATSATAGDGPTTDPQSSTPGSVNDPSNIALPLLPTLPLEEKAISLESLVQAAYRNRADLSQQKAFEQTGNDALKEAKLRAGFTLSSDFVANYQATNDIGARGLDSTFLVTGSYPLFDAGAARGAVRSAKAQLDTARSESEQIRQNIRLDTETAYRRRQLYLATSQLAKIAVSTAQENYNAAIASNKAGVGTILDVTAAEASLTQAQNQYVSAVYSYLTSDAQLKRAIGRNLPGT